MDTPFISKVWELPGLVGRVTAGALVFQNSQVAYITEAGVVFNVPLSELRDIKYPFLRMGLGFDMVANGKKYKFSFSKPNSAAPDIAIIPGEPFPQVVFAGYDFHDINILKNLKSDKAAAKEWKEILNGNR